MKDREHIDSWSATNVNVVLFLFVFGGWGPRMRSGDFHYLTLSLSLTRANHAKSTKNSHVFCKEKMVHLGGDQL